jgi:hypothetical protein
LASLIALLLSRKLATEYSIKAKNVKRKHPAKNMPIDWKEKQGNI